MGTRRTDGRSDERDTGIVSSRNNDSSLQSACVKAASKNTAQSITGVRRRASARAIASDTKAELTAYADEHAHARTRNTHTCARSDRETRTMKTYRDYEKKKKAMTVLRNALSPRVSATPANRNHSLRLLKTF
ncbi:hypothetical protein EVAR_94081_1 [Eumeta japonica]|uniref:Uncharacterized protein n=1 Tax=Eumeta variegata TaxID=151549 RepID=A0A4C1V5H1_EUMVA|nr:hypothetical protein EVAR_94081_1 [Eumeta japonica]